MSLMVRVFEVGLRLVLFCAVALLVRASVLPQQEPDSNNAMQPASPNPTRSAIEFEVMIAPKQVLVRRKGTQEWMPSSKLSEATAVGQLDGDHPIYVVTKAIKPPKAKRMPDPDYPKVEKHSGKQGEVLLHIVVDERGAFASLQSMQARVQRLQRRQWKP